MNSILVVCVGNICRSPVAEALLKARLPDKKIWSAGLAALEGRPADPLAQEVAAEHGLDISAHRAQQLRGWMCAEADLILVMESEHQREIASHYPLARGKIRCLGEQPSGQPVAVADPYRQPRPAFETAHDCIERGVSLWTRRIRQLG